MRDILIDLGEMPAQREEPAGITTTAARPPFPFRPVLGALALVLVVLLAGAAHHPPPKPPTIVAARLGDATFVDGERLYVVSSGFRADGSPVRNRVVSTYSLPDARLLGRTPVAVSGGVTWVWQGAGAVVVSYQVDTTGTWAVVAVAAGSGKVLWRRPARWVGGSAEEGLALLDAETGTGQARIGVELGTGRVRWSVPQPRDGFTASAGERNGFPRWLVTVTDSGRLETRDTHTGALLTGIAVPRMLGRANGLIWPVGDLMMVDTGGAGFDAYRLPGLEKVWHTSADLSLSWMAADCGVLLCTFRQQRGMTALDAATGREVWRSDRWIYAEAVGRHLLAATDDQDREASNGVARPRLWVLDPATGRAVGNFGSWQVLGLAGEGRIYGKLEVPGNYRVYFGELDPAGQRIRLVQSAEGVSGDCETSGDVLVCRMVDASVGIWELR